MVGIVSVILVIPTGTCIVTYLIVVLTVKRITVVDYDTVTIARDSDVAPLIGLSLSVVSSVVAVVVASVVVVVASVVSDSEVSVAAVVFSVVSLVFSSSACEQDANNAEHKMIAVIFVDIFMSDPLFLRIPYIITNGCMREPKNL